MALFSSQPRCKPRIGTLTLFSRLQPSWVAKQECSLCSLFSPIDLSILQVWSFMTSCRTDSLLLVSVSGYRGNAWFWARLSFRCRLVIAVGTVQLPPSLASIMKRHISRHFMPFLQGAAQIGTLGIIALLPPLWYCSSFSRKTFQSSHNNCSSQ